MNKETKQDYFIPFIIMVIIAVFVTAWGGMEDIYSDRYECDLKLEQTVACYKGCKYMTQPYYGLTQQESQYIRIAQYGECIELCREFYDWEILNCIGGLIKW